MLIVLAWGHHWGFQPDLPRVDHPWCGCGDGIRMEHHPGIHSAVSVSGAIHPSPMLLRWCRVTLQWCNHLQDIESWTTGCWCGAVKPISSGVGFLTLTMIFLPHGMSGQTFSSPESSRERSKKRMRWSGYGFLQSSTDNILLLQTWGMNWFDSICMLSARATAFSPKNEAWPIRNAYFDVTMFSWCWAEWPMLYYHIGQEGGLGKYRCATWHQFGMVSLIPGMLKCIRVGRHCAMEPPVVLTDDHGLVTADYELWPGSLHRVVFSRNKIVPTDSLETVKDELKIFVPRVSSFSQLSEQKLDERLIQIAAYFFLNICWFWQEPVWWDVERYWFWNRDQFHHFGIDEHRPRLGR